MQDEKKTKKELITELEELRKLNEKLENKQKKIIKKQDEAFSRVSEKYRHYDYLNNLYSTISDGIIVSEINGKIVQVNNAIVNMLGYTEDDIIGKHAADFIPEGFKPGTMLDDLYEKGFVENYESKWQSSDGSVIAIECNITIIKNSDGEIEGAVSAVRDITNRIKRDNALKESEERFQSIAESLTDALYTTDSNGDIIYINSAALRMFGYEKDELLNKSFLRLLPSDKEESYLDEFGGYLKEEAPSIFEKEFKSLGVKKDGTVFPIDVSVSNWKIRDDVYFSAVTRDITKRVETEKENIEGRDFLENLFFTIPDGLAVTDVEGKIVKVNSALVNMLGYTEQELTAMAGPDLIPKGYETRLPVVELFEHGFVKNYETMWQKKNCAVLPLDMNISLIKNIEGDVTGSVASIRDVTERKRMEADKEALEARLRQGQKMEAIGTLAGGIAHDFNNILSAVMGYTELSLDDVPEESRPYSTMNEVLIASRRARDLVDQILAFSRHSEHDNVLMKLSPLIKETVRFLKATLPSTIKVRTIFDAQYDTVLSDPTKIHQVIMNLSTNSAYAMREKGGELLISLTDKFIREEEVDKFEDVLPGNHIVLSVSDNGVGIAPDVMCRIFNPFFTTKPPGEGSGMGLSVVHGIVKSCTGDIRFESKLGKGAVFSVYLPVAEESNVMVSSATFEPIPTGDERILLVDDEITVANMMGEMLGRLGYRVTVVNNSPEALHVFKKEPYSFDLVLTDQTMPDLTGVQLAEEVLRINRDIPVILCTGFSESVSDKLAKARGICAYLMKPVSKADLANAVRQAIEGKTEE